MIKSDAKVFVEELEALLSFFSNDKVILNRPDKRKWFLALNVFDLKDIVKAFDLYASRGRFRPKPVDITDLLTGNDGRPSSEEAWALSILVADEDATIVWTSEMAAAWSLASPLFSDGDSIGARMAFKQHYERLVSSARASRKPVKWDISLGHDISQRNDSINNAKSKGIISGDRANHLLIEKITSEGQEIAGLLGYSNPDKNEKPPSHDEYKSNVLIMRKKLADGSALAKAEKELKAKLDAESLENRRTLLIEQSETGKPVSGVGK